MYHQNFTWGDSKNWNRRDRRWVEWLWIMGLLLAAVLLFGINLGGLPLRDWDEGTVAQVARDIWRSPAGSWRWLYPTLGGEPYLNKPPLMHLLIAFAYSVGGVNEWTSRLPGAILTAVSVPLLYSIGREIFRQTRTTVSASIIYLTMLPFVRHGRLAMLDGAVVCFFLFMILCLLRSRRNLRYFLGVGIGFGLICLTKGTLGLLLGALGLAFIFWDTPRLLTSWYMWAGIAIGTFPVVSWYAAQWLHYGHAFTEQAIIDQSLRRIWASVEEHSGPPWYYILEILKYAWPWLLFLPQALGKTWLNRNLSWAKLVLVWSGGYLLTISVMGTKLPWYILPIYPVIALAVGAQVAEVWNWPCPASYPRPWVAVLALLAVMSWAGSVYFSSWSPAADWELQLILAAVAGTMTLAVVLAARGDRQFLLILLWGMYVSLVILMSSRHWIWELAEAYPVKPVAAMIRSSTPIGQKIYTSYPYGRPSLNFYSDRQIIPAATSELQHHWRQNQPYFLVDKSNLINLKLESVKQLGTKAGWTLITKMP